MITFKEIETATNSTRMLMLGYIIQHVKTTSDNRITFSENAIGLSDFSEADNKYHELKPLYLFMYDGQGEPSNTHCVLAMTEDGERGDIYLHDLSTDNLFTLASMVHEITQDIFPEDVYYNEPETIDLAEDEYEVLAH